MKQKDKTEKFTFTVSKV